MMHGSRTEPGTIDVWMIALDAPGVGGAHDWALLGDDERERAERYAFVRDRQRFVARRAALRRLLAQSTGCDPGAIAYVVGRFGRPRLAQRVPDFSLSHRGDLALVAIGHVARVGVDLEWLDPAHAEGRMLAPYLEPVLAGEADAALRGGDLMTFFRWWTIVEAIAKARGTGIADERVLVQARSSWLDDVELPDDEGVARRWTLHCWQPRPGATAALASTAASVLRLHGAASSAAALAVEFHDAA
jgi:4'-phosphopantetheinyl transferase